MPLSVQMLKEDESDGTMNRGIISVLAQHAAPSPLKQYIAVSLQVSEWGEPHTRLTNRLWGQKSVGCSVHSTDTDPSFALEEMCCTLAEGETGFGDGI